MSALIFKTMTDPYVGKVSFFRVVSGTLTGEGSIHNSTQKTDERVAHVFTMRGKNQEQVNEVVAGDIGAAAKLTHATTGDTLSDKASPVVFPPIEPPEPLLPKAIEPKTKGDEDKLMIGLHRLIEEDPSLRLERNDETHQTILWGMGDAHLDVILHRLKDKFSVEVEEIPSQGSLSNDGARQSGGSRPSRQAVRRSRSVRHLQHPDRAAGARRGLRLRGQDLRRVDPPLVHSVGRKGREVGDGPGSGHRLPA